MLWCNGRREDRRWLAGWRMFDALGFGFSVHGYEIETTNTCEDVGACSAFAYPPRAIYVFVNIH